MRVTISKTGPSLNHRVWKIIYLLCFLLGFSMQVKCEDTTTVHQPDRVTYEWPLITNLRRTVYMWRFINGKAQGQEKKTPRHRQPPLPDAEPASHPPEKPGRRQERREYVALKSGQARCLALSLRRQNN